jgi:hypothetical protein
MCVQMKHKYLITANIHKIQKEKKFIPTEYYKLQ